MKVSPFSFLPSADSYRINFQVIRDFFLGANKFLNHGNVYAYNGNTAPDGAVLADGTSVKTKDFPNIFGEIGYVNGGIGNDFTLPDWSGVSVPSNTIHIMFEG